MTLLIYVSLLTNFLLSITSYFIFYKKRVLFDNRYAMTITMSSSMITSLILSMQFTFLASFRFETIIGSMMLAGFWIGAAFGALVRLHSVLSGVFAGVTGGMMGAMAGSVIKNPALCGLPMDNQGALLFNMVTFTVLGTFVLFITIGLILYSLKI